MNFLVIIESETNTTTIKVLKKTLSIMEEGKIEREKSL